MDEHHVNKGNVDAIIAQLDNFLINNTNSSAKELIKNVMELRKNAWSSVMRGTGGQLPNPYAASGDGSYTHNMYNQPLYEEQDSAFGWDLHVLLELSVASSDYFTPVTISEGTKNNPKSAMRSRNFYEPPDKWINLL